MDLFVCNTAGYSYSDHRAGVKELWAPGKVGSVGKVNFNSNMDAWASLRKYFGQKFCYGPKQQWHTWDRPKEEVLPSKRVSLAIRKNTSHPCCPEGFVTQGAETGIDGDWERGRLGMVQEAEDEGPRNHDLQAHKHDVFGAGVHRRTDTGLGRGLRSPVERRNGRSESP